MRILIDGNVLLDVLQGREPHERDSRAVWGWCENGMAEGWISSLTFANIVYIMRKDLTPETISAVLGTLSQIFRFTDLPLSDLKQASAMMWPDRSFALCANFRGRPANRRRRKNRRGLYRDPQPEGFSKQPRPLHLPVWFSGPLSVGKQRLRAQSRVICQTRNCRISP